MPRLIKSDDHAIGRTTPSRRLHASLIWTAINYPFPQKQMGPYRTEGQPLNAEWTDHLGR